jgi:hypothetical protein
MPQFFSQFPLWPLWFLWIEEGVQPEQTQTRRIQLGMPAFMHDVNPDTVLILYFHRFPIL